MGGSLCPWWLLMYKSLPLCFACTHKDCWTRGKRVSYTHAWLFQVSTVHFLFLFLYLCRLSSSLCMCVCALLYSCIERQSSVTALWSSLFEQPDETEELKMIRWRKTEKYGYRYPTHAHTCTHTKRSVHTQTHRAAEEANERLDILRGIQGEESCVSGQEQSRDNITLVAQSWPCSCGL